MVNLLLEGLVDLFSIGALSLGQQRKALLVELPCQGSTQGYKGCLASATGRCGSGASERWSRVGRTLLH
jgi:hypothetical protein